ncbi:hypothetical protein EBT31_09775 [bacterium]|nr:hypothetical protein [bacterium]
MSTRSFICMAIDEGYQGVYCHYDGYPDHVGRLLQAYHKDFAMAVDLVEGGAIRNFDNDGTAVLFGDGQHAEVYETIDRALDAGFDYAYEFDGEQWKCYAKDYAPYKHVIEVEIPV